MADPVLKKRIRDILQRERFRADDDYISVTDALPEREDDGVHVVVVSRDFEGRDSRERRSLIWSILEKLPQDDWSKVSLAIARTPESLKHTL